MLNRAQLIGHLGADPEIRVTQNTGTKLATFRVATTEKWTDKATGEAKERTEWHSIVVWNENLVGIVEKFLKKGSKVYIEGKMQTRTWHREGTPEDDKRYATEIVLNGFDAKIQLLDRPPANRPPAPAEEPDGPGKGYGRQSYQAPIDPPANGGNYPAPIAPPANGSARDPGWMPDQEIPF